MNLQTGRAFCCTPADLTLLDTQKAILMNDIFCKTAENE